MFGRLWLVWICFIFRNCHVNGATFKIKAHLAWNVFLFSLKLLSESSLLLGRPQADIVIAVRSSHTAPNIFVGFSTILYFATNFNKSAQTKISQKSVIGVRVVSCGQMDRPTDDEAISRFCA
jgi:hypothetical protein